MIKLLALFLFLSTSVLACDAVECTAGDICIDASHWSQTLPQVQIDTVLCDSFLSVKHITYFSKFPSPKTFIWQHTYCIDTIFDGMYDGMWDSIGYSQPDFTVDTTWENKHRCDRIACSWEWMVISSIGTTWHPPTQPLKMVIDTVRVDTTGWDSVLDTIHSKNTLMVIDLRTDEQKAKADSLSMYWKKWYTDDGYYVGLKNTPILEYTTKTLYDLTPEQVRLLK